MQLIFAANAIILIKQAFLDVGTKGTRQVQMSEPQYQIQNSEKVQGYSNNDVNTKDMYEIK